MKIPHTQRVIKVGDSLAVVLPKYLTDALGIQRGDIVALSCIEENVVRVRKLDEKRLHELRVGEIT